MSCGTHAHEPLRAESHLLCIDRRTCASPESLLVRAGFHAGVVCRTEPSRLYQQPWGWLKLSRALLLVSITVVCLLLTAPAHLFSDCQVLVLTNPFQVVGERMGRMCIMTLFLMKRMSSEP